MAEPSGYIHGYTDVEAQRLVEQAEILAPYVIDRLPLDGVRTLLEVGVGVGAETRLLRRRWPELRIVGVDLSQRSLERAHRLLESEPPGTVELVRALGHRLPFASDHFDAGAFIWVLEHVPEPLELMREVARCLRPGGKLVAVEVYNQTLLVEPRRPIIDEYFAALSEAQRRGGGHPNIAPRLPELATKAGLVDVQFHMAPVIGDGRDPQRRTVLLRYFQELCKSAAPQIRAAGTFPVEKIDDVWRAFDEVMASPEALLSYVGGRLEARK